MSWRFNVAAELSVGAADKSSGATTMAFRSQRHRGKWQGLRLGRWLLSVNGYGW
jgi:hypothetical protein